MSDALNLVDFDALSPQSEASTQQLAVELALHRGSAVLELGCGAGRTACQIARDKGCAVVATDNDPSMLNRAQRRVVSEGLADRVDVRFADARTLFAFLPGERFDAIFAEGVVPLLGVGVVAKQARALLPPGGTLAFTMPTWKVRDESQVPATYREAIQALYSAPLRRLDVNLNELAECGFGKGFAYELPEDAWTTYRNPMAAQLEALHAAGEIGDEGQRLADEIRLTEELGPEVFAWFVYGGFADE